MLNLDNSQDSKMIFPNPATFAVTAHHEKIIRTFHQAGALNSFSAISPAEYGIIKGTLFHRMVRNGTLVPIHDGRYYLNEARAKEVRKRRQDMIGIFLMVIAIMVLIAFFWKTV